MSGAILRVAPENVTPLWAQAEPLVTRALLGRPTHDAEDVRRMVMAQHCQLWAQWREPVLEALIVTEFAVYPKGVWVRVWLGGARRDTEMDDDGFLSAVMKWAEAHQCRGFEATGRHGWLRRFPAAAAEGLVMRWTQ